MSKRQLLCLIGVWIMIFLFLGVPSLWHKIIAAITGLIVVVIAYNLPVVDKKNPSSAHQDAFMENKQQ